jgi:hypothetical protein
MRKCRTADLFIIDPDPIGQGVRIGEQGVRTRTGVKYRFLLRL